MNSPTLRRPSLCANRAFSLLSDVLSTVAGRALAIAWTLVLGFIALVAFDLATETSPSPAHIWAGNFEGRWVVNRRSEEQHPDLARGRERLELRVTEPLQMLHPDHVPDRIDLREFDVARGALRWNDSQHRFSLRSWSARGRPVVTYGGEATPQPPQSRDEQGRFEIWMHSSSFRPKDALVVYLEPDRPLTYRRADALWPWQWFD